MANKRPVGYVEFFCNGCEKKMPYAPAHTCNRCRRNFCDACVEGEKCKACAGTSIDSGVSTR